MSFAGILLQLIPLSYLLRLFHKGIETSMSCQGLFALRNQIRRRTSRYDGEMNDALRSVGCYNSICKRGCVIS